MKTVLLSALNPADTFAQATLVELSRQLTADGDALLAIEVTGKKIADCTGCFRCWTKTPGECSIPDDAPAITAQLALADRIVFCCPVVFGGFSPDLKRVIERSIPLLLPFMRIFKGEMHHPVRYGRQYQLCGVGILDREDPESGASFRQRVRRLSRNYNGVWFSAGTVVRGDTQTAVRLHDILANREAV
jgi:multimeric flavodoxin WrbA